MYSMYYIFHIVGLALWIGSFAALGFLLRSLINHGNGLEHYSPVVNRIRFWVNAGVLPSAVIVLATGVLMMLQLNRETLPFYLTFMEQAGSLVVLFTIIVISIYSKKIGKKLRGIPLKKDKSLESLGRIYTNYLFTSATMVVLVIIVVGLRLT